MARFTFEELCGQPLGAADYATLARAFPTVLLSDVPRMDARHLTQARRFIILLDELYEHRVKLVCTAAAEPQNLFNADQGERRIDRETLDLFSDISPHAASASLFTGEEERFMYVPALGWRVRLRLWW